MDFLPCANSSRSLLNSSYTISLATIKMDCILITNPEYVKGYSKIESIVVFLSGWRGNKMTMEEQANVYRYVTDHFDNIEKVVFE